MKTEAIKAQALKTGAVIRARRKLLRLTQMQVADSMGISFQQVWKYETGISNMDLPRAAEFCKLLGLSMSDLVEVPESAEPPATVLLCRDFNQLAPELQVVVTTMVQALAKQGA